LRKDASGYSEIVRRHFQGARLLSRTAVSDPAIGKPKQEQAGTGGDGATVSRS